MEFVHGVCTGVNRITSGCRLSWAPRSKAPGFELLQLGQHLDIGVPSYTQRMSRFHTRMPFKRDL